MLIQLKKLLKMVTEELDSVNLRPDVIQDLLQAGTTHEQITDVAQDLAIAPTTSTSSAEQRATPSMLLHHIPGSASCESKDSSPAAEWLAMLPSDHQYRNQRRQSKKRSYSTGSPLLKTAENLPDTFVLQPKHQSPVSSSSSPRRRSMSSMAPLHSASTDDQLPPLMLPSGQDSPKNPLLIKAKRGDALVPSSPLNPFSQSEEHDWNASHWQDQREPVVFPSEMLPDNGNMLDDTSSSQHGWIQLDSGRRAWAEYQMLTESLHLHPQLVIHIESPDLRSNESSPDSLQSATTARLSRKPQSNESTPNGSASQSPAHALPNQVRRLNVKELNLGPAAQNLPSSPMSDKAEGLKQGSISQEIRRRRVIIPLLADERFFESLSAALRKLLQLHVMQQAALVRHVNALRDVIAVVASPENSPKDLYRWREIFSLWVEHDIFESSREKDRGELSVASSEKRLRKYLGELEKRGFLAPHRSVILQRQRASSKLDTWDIGEHTQTNPLQDTRSIQALEHFLRLNVALLSLKRFQRLNIETVRKILKKHEKKTALHAHQALSRMIVKMRPNGAMQAATQDTLLPDLDWDQVNHADILQSLSVLVPSTRMSYSQLSLPRILASILTQSLLPVLPSVDDYSCLVCTGLAYQPIRLRCKHIFCIRCLVKMQKRGENDCPLCRSTNAVHDADGSNLDHEMADYLRTWFPMEVEEKIEENKSDRVLEDRREVELKRKKLLGRFRRRTRQEGHQDCVII